MDFFLWGYVKAKVYEEDLPENENEAQMELMARIQAAFISITPEMARKATQSVLRRSQMCLDAGGRHFQQKLHQNVQ